MRFLIVSDENKARARRVVEYASAPERYFSDQSTTSPGDDPGHVAMFESGFDPVRCVFTITVVRGVRFRHLSVDSGRPGFLPNPVLVATVATWFGFTGAPMSGDLATDLGPTWAAGRCETCPDCGVLQLYQPLEEN